MARYIIKRLLLTIPTLLAVIFLVFVTLNITPSNPGEMILGKDAAKADIEALNKSFGLDKPVITRFVNYVGNVLQGDFGRSYRTNKPVVDELFEKFPVTLTLVIMTMCLSYPIGLGIGILCGIKQYSFFDVTATVTALVLAAIPGFLTAIVLMLIFSLKLKWLPSGGIGSWKNFVLPVATSIISGVAGNIRTSRALVIETMRQDYVRSAKAKGASKGLIIRRHVLKNALRPVFVSLGMSFSFALGGSVITETIFGLPGVGSVILRAVQVKDIPMILLSTIFLASVYCVMMIVADLINAYIDPRIRAQFAR